ncbi:MAG: hypothetical protein WD096_01945 [Actinomycetota bacterium]
MTAGAAGVPQASADPFGGCSVATGEGCRADSNIHSYCYGAGFDASLEDEAEFAMNISLDRDTLMSDLFSATCDPASTDVKWLDANLGGSRGEYICLEPFTPYEPDGICFVARIRLDPDQINIGSNDAEDRKKTACHEVGHSVGLQHGDDKTDCMINGEIPDTSATWRTFNGHHIAAHIDSYYG